MKAEDLMIGDKLKTVFSQKIVEVKEIKQNCIYTEDNGYEYNEIEPIPITPEILARMGFTIEEVPKYDDTYTEDEYTATIKCVDSRKCEVEIEYKTYWKKLRAFNYDPHNRLGFTSIETQVEYVHELQHAFRLLNIEKEWIV